jgi:hypothetical protein
MVYIRLTGSEGKKQFGEKLRLTNETSPVETADCFVWCKCHRTPVNADDGMLETSSLSVEIPASLSSSSLVHPKWEYQGLIIK